MTYSRALTRVNDGDFTLTDASDRNISQIVWSAYEGGGYNAVRGESVFDPWLKKKTSLSDEPEQGEITLRTAYNDTYAVWISRWAKKSVNRTDIVGVGRRGKLRYDVKGCSFVSLTGLEPIFDKNGNATTAAFLELKLKPTEVTLVA